MSSYGDAAMNEDARARGGMIDSISIASDAKASREPSVFQKLEHEFSDAIADLHSLINGIEEKCSDILSPARDEESASPAIPHESNFERAMYTNLAALNYAHTRLVYLRDRLRV